MTFDFTNQTVLVTGGSRGIGRAISIAFATAGARVAINFRHNAERAEETLGELPGEGHIAVAADLTESDQLSGLVDAVLEQFDSIDILVNNAGIYGHHPIDELDFADYKAAWDKTIRTNLLAPAELTWHVANAMILNGGGRIVNISSRGAFRGEPQAPAYAAAKGGLNSMAQSLAIALAPHNIFIGTVAPGFVQTEMARPILDGATGDAIRNQSPLGRVANAEEVARVALFLASEGTEFTTGTIVDVNGASFLRM